MSPEERQLLTGLFDRIHAAADAPRDADAEAFIAAAVRQLPFAPYLLAQSVIVQDETLKAAAKRIEELEARVRDLESAAKPQSSTSFLGGIGKSILGSGAQPSQQPVAQERSPWTQMRQQQQEPASQPQMGQPMGQYGGQGQPMGQQMPQAGGGGGFLKGALGTAAGVAGGMMLANSLSSMLGGHNSPFGSSPAKAADLPGSSGDSASKSDALSDIDKWSDRNKDADSSSKFDDGKPTYASDSSSSDYDGSGDDDSDGYDSGSDSWGDSDTTDI